MPRHAGGNRRLFGRDPEGATGLQRELSDTVDEVARVSSQEVPELNYLADTWVDYPLYQVLEDFQASLEEDPGTPDPDY